MLFSHVWSKAAFVLLFLAAILFSVDCAEADWITNGDFEEGNTGFKSNYSFFEPDGIENMTEAKYAIWDDPHYVHGKWPEMGDHTTGDGLMLIANGAGNPQATLWSQDFDFTAGVTYTFSAWATNLFTSYPANLEFELEGVSLGTLQLTSEVGQWQQFSTEFTILTGGPGQLRICDLETANIGNDFAIDDISLTVQMVPEPTSAILLCTLFGMLIVLKRKK